MRRTNSWHRRGGALLAALAVAVVGQGAGGRGAAAARTDPTLRPVRGCAELVGDYPIAGAAAHVTAATSVPAGAEPAHCDVRGYVEPAVRFQLRLPVDGYAGRYLQYGCAGLCGGIQTPAFPAGCAGSPGGDVAVAATDDGHASPGEFPAPIVDGTWAATDQAARDDYFFRAPHVVSVAAKRIIAGFYGAPPRRSYFDGCSTGGREGLLLAQRYPTDFDGIVAGAPANYMGPLMGLYFAWLSTVDVAADGQQVITADKLPALHAAVIAACDGLDGLVDQQIEDPRACHFDPAQIQCPAGADRLTCLTAAQVAKARELYRGPTDTHGRRLYPGWESRGSELAWFGSIIPIPGVGSLAPLPDNYLRYVGYPIGSPHSSLADFPLTVAGLNRLTPEGAKGNALSLDLSAFRRAGGKLIISHGWDDQSIPAVGTVDYYTRLAQRSGGLRATQEWARLFMVPTLYHCFTGGYQLTEFDPFRSLVSWVEHGSAPGRIVAVGRDAQGTVTRSRPVFPYPLRARYDGSGSVDDAGNFVPAPPLVPPTHDVIDWAGSYLHGVPGPVAG